MCLTLSYSNFLNDVKHRERQHRMFLIKVTHAAYTIDSELVTPSSNIYAAFRGFNFVLFKFLNDA